MSKFMCYCGNIIRDQTDYLPYKGRYFADEDTDALFEGLIPFLARLVEATEKREQAAFRGDYPEELDISNFISDHIAGYSGKFGRHIYECEQCGRLWLQYDRPGNRYTSYMPETEIRGVLRSQELDDDEKLLNR